MQIVVAEKSNLKFILFYTFILNTCLNEFLHFSSKTNHTILGSGSFCKIQPCLVALFDDLVHFMVLFLD